MTDYVKSTNFTSKDSLPSGNALKIIKGTEFDVEFSNIATAIATKVDTGGSFGTALSFFIGKYESLEVTYLGSNKWALTNFQTAEDLSLNPITNRIY